MRLTGEGVHYYRENEFRHQVSSALNNTVCNLKGLETVTRLIDEVICNHDLTSYQAIGRNDISNALGLIEDYASILADDIAQVEEALGQDEVRQALSSFKGSDLIERYRWRDHTPEEQLKDEVETFNRMRARK